MPTRRFRFSLRVLLLAMSFFAVFLGLYANSARKQSRGVAWVLSQGGHVSYAYELPLADGSYPMNALPPGPDWLRRKLGMDYFSSVTGVILDRDEINDLDPLADFPNLRFLALMNSVSPDTDFSSLRCLKHLKTLDLGYTGIDLDELQKIKQILPDCKIINHDLQD
jgi:hypothetical protein